MDLVDKGDMQLKLDVNAALLFIHTATRNVGSEGTLVEFLFKVSSLLAKYLRT